MVPITQTEWTGIVYNNERVREDAKNNDLGVNVRWPTSIPLDASITTTEELIARQFECEVHLPMLRNCGKLTYSKRRKKRCMSGTRHWNQLSSRLSMLRDRGFYISGRGRDERISPWQSTCSCLECAIQCWHLDT